MKTLNNIKDLFFDRLTAEERADYQLLENGCDDPLWQKGSEYVDNIYKKLEYKPDFKEEIIKPFLKYYFPLVVFWVFFTLAVFTFMV